MSLVDVLSGPVGTRAFATGADVIKPCCDYRVFLGRTPIVVLIVDQLAKVTSLK